jgi:hypothetical protein
MSPGAAARDLVGGTYSAGELRRYWPFAATVALGTGLGPAHPPLGAVCEELTARVPAFEVLLPSTPSLGFADLARLVAAAGQSRPTEAVPQDAAGLTRTGEWRP